jgi:DNA polymerase III delta subunit
MLYVFFGTDTTQVRTKAFSFLAKLNVEEKSLIKIASETYARGMIPDLTRGSSLFGGVDFFLLDTPSEDEMYLGEVLEHAALLQDSQNHFVVIENGLTADKKKIIEKHAEKIEEIKADAKVRFNTFALTDAFLERDKKSLWLLLVSAWKEGLSHEEIIGVLFWQIKILRLVEKTNSAEEAGQKPFVYSKAKRSLKNFKKGELDALSESLLRIYHDGHQGRVDIAIALEQWALTI